MTVGEGSETSMTLITEQMLVGLPLMSRHVAALGSNSVIAASGTLSEPATSRRWPSWSSTMLPG
jgi:hypothetical protein